jgi:hypothetical protein
MPILVVVPTLAARISVSVVFPRLIRPRKPGQQASQFLNTGITQLLNRIPNVTHREHAGQPHGWQSDAADGDDRGCSHRHSACFRALRIAVRSSCAMKLPDELLKRGSWMPVYLPSLFSASHFRRQRRQPHSAQSLPLR